MIQSYIVYLQRMQKKKLDLNHLLAKYEGASQGAYQSPVRESSAYNALNNYIDEEFYQYPANSRTQQDPHPLPERPQQFSRTTTASNQFSMSKSQVEAYLHSLKEDIRNEERSVNKQVELSLKVILDNFQKNHQRLRRELLDILDRAFAENQRRVKEELAKQSKTQSPEFAIVYRKITALDQDIDRLLNSLRGPDYKKTIAEVVTRDFSLEINQLKGISASAKNAYGQSLGEVEFDRSRVEAIKDNLSKLFYINRKAAGLSGPGGIPSHIHEVSNSIFSVVKEKVAEQPVAQSRTRKSFFNFGSD